MRNQLLPLLQNEISKAVRRKLPFFGIVITWLVCVLVRFIASELSNAAVTNAWGYTAFSMQLVFTDIGPIFIVVFAAMLVAEETGSGTIRAALSVPVHRWELFVAKTATGLIYMLAVSLAALLLSAALSKVHYQFGAVGDTFGTVYTRQKAMQEFALGWALSWIPLTGLVLYGMLVSTLVRNPGSAVATAIGMLIFIDFAKHLAGIDPYIFTRYISYPWQILQQMSQGMDYQWSRDVWRMIQLCGASSVILFATGLILFVRQDLNHGS